MSTLIVIPARYGSTRYPGKPLVPLRGATGKAKPLLERSWHAARAIEGVDRVVIATDDARIADAARGFGAEVVMTPATCANGTERCAIAHARLGGGFDVVINFQGDAPLTPPWFVSDVLGALAKDSSAQMATPVLRCDGATLDTFLQDRRAGRVGATTAVFSSQYRALYFSKQVIPFCPQPQGGGAPTPVFHHVGVYGFRAAALEAYPRLPVGPLERNEQLEQLRFLENGHAVLCVPVQAHGRRFWELNTPEDIPRIEAIMAQAGIP
ncbi:MAG: 3-deoxy-manno-octulosonate cytidylyltransferase [Rhodobacteraceae bacterium]|nr:3-deoxy-manno-octulosonate cytidylyltransferase [Paracoccaceae bacterium]